VTTSVQVVAQVPTCCKSAILKGATSNVVLELSAMVPVVLTIMSQHKFGTIQDL
jgi:hypothetical protein